ncbi:MAG: methyltransferase domain-containing protein [Acidobacteriota bacterium]
MENWFKEWFDENYLLLYRHRDEREANLQFNLILDKVNPEKNWRILDLACGEGRYTYLFKNSGFDIKGIDLSETLINSGREKYKGLKLEICDMRNIKGKFDMILSLFTSFGYFLKEKENMDVISGIYNSLNPGGVFWLDFLNPGFVRKTLVNKGTKKIVSGMEILEERSIEGNRIVKRITIVKGEEKKRYTESVRLFSKAELSDMMKRSGFQIMEFFGNYSGDNWSDDSERTIVFAIKQQA